MAGIVFDATIYTLELDDMQKVIDAFKFSEMRKAVRVFLKACLARIPIRTGFLKGAFTELNRAFGSEAGADFSTQGRILKKGKLSPTSILAGILQGNEELFASREKARDAKLSDAGKARRSQLLDQHKRAAFRQRVQRENASRKARGLPRSTEQYQEFYYDGKNKILKTDRSGIPFATSPDNVLKVTDNTISFNLDVNISYYRINDFSGRGRGTPWESLDAGTAAMLNFLEKSANRFPDITEILTNFKIGVDGSTLRTSKTRPNIEGVIRSRFLSISSGI